MMLWFNERFDSFIYVDRIAVLEETRNTNRSCCCSSVENNILTSPRQRHVLEPPNPGSMRFHHRFSFEEIGTLHHKEKSVAMLLRKRIS